MAEFNMESCQFCGAKNHATIESRRRHTWRNGFGDSAEYETFHVRCTVCHARGATVRGYVGRTEYDGKIVKIYGNDVTLHRYRYYAEKAVEAWNRRADNG